MSEQTTNGEYTIDYLMLKAGVLVNNAALPEILEEMAPVGYHIDEVQKGQQLHNRAEELCRNREKEFGDQIGATDKVEKLKAKANKKYMKTLKFARIQLEGDKDAAVSLGLKGRRKKTTSGWVVQAKQFYCNLPKKQKWMDSMGEISITHDRLSNELDDVIEVEDAYNVQQDEMGEAQEATILRDEALEELFDWTSRYKKMARLALEDHPQWLEKLGITEKN